MLHRNVNLPKNKSFFLFGARGTGKSTLLDSHFENSPHLKLDLLDPETEDELAKRPAELSQRIAAHAGPNPLWVVIDEVQRNPRLLDVVHAEIHKQRGKVLFALTGSSARKLKRGHANMLAGRALVRHLYPLTQSELGEKFSLEHQLRWGSLPELLSLEDDDSKSDYLRSYAHTYLKEEIQSEQIVRNLPPFRRFLEVAAQSNGHIINNAAIARDVGVDLKTVQNYFEILEDTHIGVTLPAFHRSIRKAQRQAPKFYLFDAGVKRALDRTLNVPLPSQTFEFGRAFEHFIILEAMRRNDYLSLDYKFSYLRTKDDAEIDLIIERPGRPNLLVEIKSTTSVEEKSANALARFLPEFRGAEAQVWSRDTVRKRIGDVTSLPWKEGLDAAFV